MKRLGVSYSIGSIKSSSGGRGRGSLRRASYNHRELSGRVQGNGFPEKAKESTKEVAKFVIGSIASGFGGKLAFYFAVFGATSVSGYLLLQYFQSRVQAIVAEKKDHISEGIERMK